MRSVSPLLLVLLLKRQAGGWGSHEQRLGAAEARYPFAVPHWIAASCRCFPDVGRDQLLGDAAAIRALRSQQNYPDSVRTLEWWYD